MRARFEKYVYCEILVKFYRSKLERRKEISKKKSINNWSHTLKTQYAP